MMPVSRTRMPVAGALLIVLGILLIGAGIAGWDAPLEPAPAKWPNVGPARLSWGMSGAAFLVALGVSAIVLGSALRLEPRKPRAKARRL